MRYHEITDETLLFEAMDNYIESGYVKPNQDRILAKPKEIHDDLARTLGYLNIIEALRAGLIRYAVSQNGDGQISLIDDPANFRTASQYLASETRIRGQVYVDVRENTRRAPIHQHLKFDGAAEAIKGLTRRRRTNKF